MDENTCSKKNMYEEEYTKAFSEFEEKYGFLGTELQTEEELQENKRTSTVKIHFMNELPAYKQISDLYNEEEKRLDEYRNSCKDEALDMLKQYYYDLWD